MRWQRSPLASADDLIRRLRLLRSAKNQPAVSKLQVLMPFLLLPVIRTCGFRPALHG
jgi:hypothetical protein